MPRPKKPRLGPLKVKLTAAPLPAPRTPQGLRESYRVACRKPASLESWAFDNVPWLLDRLEDLPRYEKRPTCEGLWLFWDRAGNRWHMSYIKPAEFEKYGPDVVFFGPMLNPEGTQPSV